MGRQPKSRYSLKMAEETRRIQCLSPAGFHELAYTETGKGEVPALCVHGLTRNRHDFSELIAALKNERRVVAVDMAGRGESDWLKEPLSYSYPQYLADITVLLARIGAVKVDWVGTSMGGLIGMMLAALPHTPIRRLVMNDIGPFIALDGLDRLKTYVGKEPAFTDKESAELYLRQQYAGFAPMQDADWRFLTDTSLKPAEKGWRLHYDPAIALNLNAVTAAVDLWGIWDQVKVPTLVLRGAESDLLSRKTAEEMTKRGPQAIVIEYPRAGHAPSLRGAEQINTVRQFLGP